MASHKSKSKRMKMEGAEQSATTTTASPKSKSKRKLPSEEGMVARQGKMSKRTAPPTAGGASGGPQNCSASTRLPSLLTELNGGGAISLSVMSAIRAADHLSRNKKSAKPPSVERNLHEETVQSTLDELFAAHVGRSRDVVIGNAVRCAVEELQREHAIFHKIQRGTYFGNEREKRLSHPENYKILGPKPDGRIWLVIFLGEERAGELLKGRSPMNLRDDDDTDDEDEPMESVVSSSLAREASELPVVDLLGNVLSYARKVASEDSLDELLRMSVLYGLDGVMRDVLLGNYGDVGDLTVDSLQPLNEKLLEENPSPLCSQDRRMFMPPYAMGAILGHTNVVVTALTELGGKMDTPLGMQFKLDEEVRTYDDHTLPSEVFHWVFQKNMPDVIKCLVEECGFQFRWISHDHMSSIFNRIFDTNEWAEFHWAGELDEEELMYECRRDRCRMREGAAYKVQMKMLDMLIGLGFPFTLFFPVDPPIELEERLTKEKKLETRQECKAFVKGLSKEQRKARDIVWRACCAYNGMQASEPKMLTMKDFYRKLKSRWKNGQDSAQVDRLDEFEALDSRWRKTRMQQDDEEGVESDEESGSGSSYEYPFDS